MGVRGVQPVRFEHHLGQLFDEQRHAVRLDRDLLHQRRGQRPALGHVLHHDRDVLARQAVQHDLRHVRAQRPRRAEVGPVRQQQQQPGARRMFDEQAEEFERRRVAPVQVFDHAVDRLFGGLLQKPGDQGFVHGLLLLLRGAAQPRIAIRVRQRQQRRENGQHRVEREMLLGEPARQLFEFPFRRLVGLEIEDALQEVDQWIERAAPVVGGAAVFDHSCPTARGYALGQRLDETGLADAGFAADQHDLPMPFLGLLPAFPQDAELLLAPGQRREAGLQRYLERTARPGICDDPIGLDRLGHAAQAPGAQVLCHEQPAHELVRIGADVQRAGRGRGLEPCRDVWHRAGDVHRVAADLAGHDQPGMRADAHLQRMFEPRRELLDFLDDVEPGVQRARRVVLVRHRIAEERQHAVAEILRDVAGVVKNDPCAPLVIDAQDVAPLFGVQPFGQLRRTHQVAEHDRDLAPVRGDLRCSLSGARLLGSRTIRRSD